MTTKHDTPDFEYTNPARLERYLNDEIGMLYWTGKELTAIHEHARKRLDDKSYNEVVDVDCSRALLGGTTDSGTSNVRDFYEQLFGIQFQSPATARELNRRHHPIDVTVSVETTEFTRYLSDVTAKCETILRRSGIDPSEVAPDNVFDVTDTEFENFLTDTDAALEKVTDHIAAVQQILPNYSEWGLFVWSIHLTPLQFLTECYPSINRNTAGISKVRETLDIGKETFSISNSTDQVEFGGYRDNTLGEALVELYQLLWVSYDTEIGERLRPFVNGVPNYCSAYLKQTSARLSEANYEFPDSVRRLYRSREGPNVSFRESLSLVEPSPIERTFTDEERRESLTDSIEELAPLFFYFSGLTFTIVFDSDEPRLMSL